MTDNAMGWTAVRLHYRADEERNPDHPDEETREKALKWLETAKAAYPAPEDWEREMEVNFNAGHGQRVFPQFSEMYHSRTLQFNPRKVVYRGWDFGWHQPICLFAQVDKDGRLCVIREIAGSKQTTHDFAQLVIARSAQWLPHFAAGFEDRVDSAGQQVKSIENEKNERRDVDVLMGLNIHPMFEYGWSRKEGRTLIHRLLTVRGDGTPGLLIDPAGCPLLTQAFLGRYIFPETKDGKIRDEPDDDTHPWADLMAAMRYLVTGLHKRLGLSRFQLGQGKVNGRQEPPFTGYGTVRR